MKRILILLVSIVLIFSACAPAVSLPQPPSEDRTQQLLPLFSEAWGYCCLDEQQQNDYAALYTAVYDGMATETYVTTADDERVLGLSVTLPSPLSEEEQATQLYQAFFQDNPQFFHLGAKYSFDGRQWGEKKLFTTLTLTYTMSAEQRVLAAKQLETAVTTLVSDLPDNEFEKELLLHDRLLAQCTYDQRAADSQTPLEEYPNSFTIYGALVEGRAVCEGYSRALQYVLQRADMGATVITGFDSQKQAHMWNVVRVDGQFYHVDATWDDRQDNITHTYFNLTDEAIGKTHQSDKKTLGLSAMTATAQQYYVRTASYLDTTRLEQVAAFFAQRLAKGETVVDVQFSNAAFRGALFFVRSTDWFVQTVNAELPQGQEPLDEYCFVYDELHHTITLYKK